MIGLLVGLWAGLLKNRQVDYKETWLGDREWAKKKKKKNQNKIVLHNWWRIQEFHHDRNHGSSTLLLMSQGIMQEDICYLYKTLL